MMAKKPSFPVGVADADGQRVVPVEEFLRKREPGSKIRGKFRLIHTYNKRSKHRASSIDKFSREYAEGYVISGKDLSFTVSAAVPRAELNKALLAWAADIKARRSCPSKSEIDLFINFVAYIVGDRHMKGARAGGETRKKAGKKEAIIAAANKLRDARPGIKDTETSEILEERFGRSAEYIRKIIPPKKKSRMHQ
jgi:hypothetical protein